MALTEAMEQEGADTRMLLLANDEFDKETGGYKNESEEAEDLISEKELSPIRSASKKTKASMKLQSSKEKKHRQEVLNGARDERVTGVKGDEQASMTPTEAEKPETHFEPEASNAENKKVSKDPSPAAANKAGNSWTILKRDSGWNKYADNGFVVHLKGSKLGPTLKLLRSTKKQWLE